MAINDTPQLRDGQGNLLMQQYYNPGSGKFEAGKLNAHKRPAAPYKPKGNPFTPNIGLANIFTASLKQDLEAPFDAVRVVKWSTQLAAGVGWKMMVAATETADTSTQANRFQPIVGNTAYHSLRGASANYGWNTVTFGGKASLTDTPSTFGVVANCAYTITANVVTVTTPAQDPPWSAGQVVTVQDFVTGGIPKSQYTLTAGSATTATFALAHADATGNCSLVAGSPFTNPGIVVSDLIACPSVPRGTTNAADTGQTRPLILLRSFFDGRNGVPGDWANVAASDDVPTARNRGRINQLGGSFGDGVGSFAENMSSSFAYVHPVFMIPYYRRPVYSVAVVGDSTHESTFLSTDKASGWLSRSCYDAGAALGQPVVPYNLGMGSGTSTYFTGFARKMFDISAPSVVFYQPYTVNDYASTPTQRLISDAWARALDFVQFCAERRVTVILTTPMINENYNLASDNLRKQARDMVIDLAKMMGCLYVDFTPIVGDGASPEKFKVEYKDTSVHYNDAALDPLAVPCTLALLQVLG